jgi:hypothetical protein
MSLKYPQKARDASFNNVGSGLAATNVQDALEELGGTAWTTWTPTGTFTTNTTYTGRYKFENGWLHMAVELAFGGAPNSVACYIDIPPGFTRNLTAIPTWDYDIGGGGMRDVSASLTYSIMVMPNDNLDRVHPVAFNAATTYTYVRGVTQAQPIATIENGDYMRIYCKIPARRT